MVTICGMAPDWDIKRCRTLPIMEAAEAWGQWWPLIMATSPTRRLRVDDHIVWIESIGL